MTPIRTRLAALDTRPFPKGWKGKDHSTRRNKEALQVSETLMTVSKTALRTGSFRIAS